MNRNVVGTSLIGHLGVLLLLVHTSTAGGHDIPNARVDRAIQVELLRGELRIDYEVSLAELTLAQDLRNLIGSLPGADRQALYQRYGEETGPLNARGFLVSADGRAVELEHLGFDLAVEEHPRFTFHLAAEIPPAGRLSVQDTNYVASEGTSRLALRAGPGVEVEGYDGPADVANVPIRPVWQLSDEEESRTRRVEVTYREAGGLMAPVVRPPPSPAPIVSRSVQPEPVEPAPPNGLTRLLDRVQGASLLGLWLLALGLGSAHAIQPGHGKTLVAAATVGERAGWARGVVLAIVTTLTHFSVVLGLAGLIWLTKATRYAAIHGALARSAGFAIAAVGLWRLGRHLAGYGEHDAVAAPVSAGGRGLVGLGIAGGLVPCWDAVVLVLLADLAGRLVLGIFLLSGFSLGMAVVLVAVGLVAGRFRGYLAGRDGEGRWERGLGIASGLALSAIGLYLFLF